MALASITTIPARWPSPAPSSPPTTRRPTAANPARRRPARRRSRLPGPRRTRGARPRDPAGPRRPQVAHDRPCGLRPQRPRTAGGGPAARTRTSRGGRTRPVHRRPGRRGGLSARLGRDRAAGLRRRRGARDRARGIGLGQPAPARGRGRRAAGARTPGHRLGGRYPRPRGEATATYGGPGGGAELAHRGVLGCGYLRSGQARVLLATLLALAAGGDPAAAAAEVRRQWSRYHLYS